VQSQHPQLGGIWQRKKEDDNGWVRCKRLATHITARLLQLTRGGQLGKKEERNKKPPERAGARFGQIGGSRRMGPVPSPEIKKQLMFY